MRIEEGYIESDTLVKVTLGESTLLDGLVGIIYGSQFDISIYIY
jgi:hypothetical protein